MLPSPAPTPPIGDGWIHEAKLDGFRAQVHLVDGVAAIYSRNGADFTKRFRSLVPAIERIPARTAVVDCELIACGHDGMPCFRTLIGGNASQLCLWCFDLLQVDGVRIMALPLVERRERLRALLADVDSSLQFSDAFADPRALLAAGERTGLEGVVSKRADSVYRSGRTKAWLKTKTEAWRQNNRWRHEAFAKTR